MKIKLTLRLAPWIVKEAKHYAASHGTSVSQIVTDYLSILEKTTEATSIKGLPLTRALCGVLKGSSITREDYKTYLEKKYR